jgi:hypothetical protein
LLCLGKAQGNPSLIAAALLSPRPVLLVGNEILQRDQQKRAETTALPLDRPQDFALKQVEKKT